MANLDELSHGGELPRQRQGAEVVADALKIDRLAGNGLLKEANILRLGFIRELEGKESCDRQWPLQLSPGGLSSGAMPLSKIYEVGDVLLGPSGVEQTWHADKVYKDADVVPITPRFKITYATGEYDPRHKSAFADHYRRSRSISNALTVEVTEKGLRVMHAGSDEPQNLPNRPGALMAYLTALMPHDALTEEAHYRLISGYGDLESKLNGSEPLEGHFAIGLGQTGVVHNIEKLVNHNFARVDFCLHGNDGRRVGMPFKVEFDKQGGRVVLKEIVVSTGLGERFSQKVKAATQKALERLQVEGEQKS